jgi:hypothetical protein
MQITKINNCEKLSNIFLGRFAASFYLGQPAPVDKHFIVPLVP